MPKRSFVIQPYHLHVSHKYSCNEVDQEEMPKFFKDLSRYMKENPNMVLEDIRTSYTGRENIYLFEIQWVNENE